jgi:F0F1-type ATP synthase beta subunit
MLVINFSNVQKIIFSDIEVQNKLPEFKKLFQQWKMGQFAPSLRPMAQKALLDLLNQLGDEQVRTLELYFGTSIKIEKLDYDLVKSYELPIIEAQELIDCLGIFGEVFLHRDANHLYISSWR